MKFRGRVLHFKLETAKLNMRWHGDYDDLNDPSRSGLDFSIAALLKIEDFSDVEIAKILMIAPHGSAWDKSKYDNDYKQLRYIARCILRTSGGNQNGDIDSIVDELNGQYAYTIVGGNPRIAKFSKGTDGFDDVELIKVESLKHLLANRSLNLTLDGKFKKVSVMDIWLKDINRGTYANGLGFWPPGTIAQENAINLWTQWGAIPIAGDWPHIKYHLEQIICSGNREHYEYLLNWIAHLLQHPSEKPGVAITLLGGEGTGKGALMELLRNLVGKRHSILLSQNRQLIGQFNAHLQDKLLVTADEAFFAGDPSSRGALKSLLTEPEFVVERKGVDITYGVASYHRFIFASNEDWVVHASSDSRRFFVLQVSDAKAQNHQYFKPLFDAIRGKEAQAFMGAMLNLNLEKTNIRQAPKTDALDEQRLRSLGLIEEYFLHLLSNSIKSETKKYSHNEHYPEIRWYEKMPKSHMFEAYIQFHKSKSRSNRSQSASVFWRRAQALFPSMVNERPRDEENNRCRLVIFPALKQAKIEFSASVKIVPAILYGDGDDQ